MGSFMGKMMEEQFQKQQDFMVKNQEIMLERQLQMQNQMRERQMAMMIARSRDMFHFYTCFYACVVLAGIAGIKNKKPAAVAPLIPFSIIWAYQGDLAYGDKMVRVRVDADKILDNQRDLIALPHGLPTLHTIETARLQAKSD